jgi:hypothetical protein
MIPRRQPDQPFDAHQRDMAEWMGCSLTQLNAEHDAYHRALCAWLGVPSEAMKDAAGEPHDGRLAGLEEEAVLHVQRLAVAHGVGVPA